MKKPAAKRKDVPSQLGLADGDVERLQLLADLGMALEPYMRWISKGRRTMDQRGWVFGYAFDRVGEETIEHAAKRMGVSPQRLHYVVKEFSKAFPDVRIPHQKSAATRAKMSAAHRRKKDGAK